jgi:carbonic anhydrase
VRAAFEDARLGLIDNWLRHVEDVKRRHEHALAALEPDRALDRLCEATAASASSASSPGIQATWAAPTVSPLVDRRLVERHNMSTSIARRARGGLHATP